MSCKQLVWHHHSGSYLLMKMSSNKIPVRAAPPQLSLEVLGRSFVCLWALSNEERSQGRRIAAEIFIKPTI